MLPLTVAYSIASTVFDKSKIGISHINIPTMYFIILRVLFLLCSSLNSLSIIVDLLIAYLCIICISNYCNVP